MVCLFRSYQKAPLFAHLNAQGVEFIQFAFRWMNCLLMRELSLRNTIRMWDTYMSEGSEGFSDFHLYVCAAFLVKWSDKLKKMEFQACFWDTKTRRISWCFCNRCPQAHGKTRILNYCYQRRSCGNLFFMTLPVILPLPRNKGYCYLDDLSSLTTAASASGLTPDSNSPTQRANDSLSSPVLRSEEMS